MAIANTAASAGSYASASSATLSHTCTAGDILFVCILTLGDSVTGVTYNGVAMTQLRKRQCTKFGATNWQYIYFLSNPASGANNIVASFSPNSYCELFGASYSGASPTQYDSTSQGSGTTTGSGSPFTLTTTVVAANSWLLSWTKDGSGGSTAGSGTYRRSPRDSGAGDQGWDSNGAVAAGARSLNHVNTFNPTDWDGIIISIAPFVPTSLVGNERTPIRGVMRGTMRP